MKAYFACSDPWNTTDEVIYTQVKTYMDPDVVKSLKHTIEGNTCSWNILKKNLELAFGRKNFHFEDLHTQFLQRKQIVDESFSSFYIELWVLCDEMQAMNGDNKNAKAFEMKFVNQFVHGLHDRLVKIDVKKYFSNGWN